MRWSPARAWPLLALAATAAALAPGPLALRAQDRPPVVTSLTLFAGTTGGLWRSTDWGGRWRKVEGRPEGASLAEVGAVRGVVAQARSVYIASDAGVFASGDFGETWRKLGLEGAARSVLPSRYFHADPTMFAGTADGLLKSTDAGLTFKPTALRGTLVTHLEWPGPALILASGHGVVVSPDAGVTFTSGMGLPEGGPSALAVSSYFAVDPVLFTAVGTAGVFRSPDGGKTWAPAGLSGTAVHDLVWLGPILYAATPRGLLRSDDVGKSWKPVPGLATRASTDVFFPLAPGSGLEVFLATTEGIVHSADGGAHWKAIGSPDDPVLCLATFPPPDPLPLSGKGAR